MDDLTLLREGMNRCQAHILDLNAEIDFIFGKNPIDRAALEDVIRRFTEALDRLRAIATALTQAPANKTRQ